MKLRYSEIFYSIQGEGRFVGVPSIFLRVFGCNFQCAGFGQERGKLIATDQMPYMTDPRADRRHLEAYTDISQLPVTTMGCDSSASWAMKYKHLQRTEPLTIVEREILDLLPFETTFLNKHAEDIHLVLTGGEPLLGWQRCWPELFESLRFHDLHNITFETNGSQVVSQELIDYFNGEGKNIHVTWSVSPKLSISGETEAETFNSAALESMNKVENSYLYTKFVVRDAVCFDEVDKFLTGYLINNVNIDSVYCMPEGATLEQQALTARNVADICMEKGYRYSPRLHIDLFGNEWGT